MQKYNVTSKSMFVMVETPVEVAQIKATMVTQLICYENKDNTLGYDVEPTDVTNITYMGMPVDGYKEFNKLKEFHTGMGINLQDLLNKAEKEVLTKSVMDKIVQEHCSGLLEVKQVTVKSTTDKPTWDEVKKALMKKFGVDSIQGTYYNDKRKTFRRIKMGDYNGKKLAWLNKQYPTLKAYRIAKTTPWLVQYTAIKFDL